MSLLKIIMIKLKLVYIFNLYNNWNHIKIKGKIYEFVNG
jgi:hypothetical protein